MFVVRKNNYFWLLFASLSFFFSDVSAVSEPLRADNFISVESGKVAETGILSDANGMIFLEFSDRTRIVRADDRTSFQGEILSPSIIALPGDKPRGRMREILTFEMLGDTADELLFTDQFYIMRSRSRLRYQLLNPDARQSILVRALIPIQEPVGRLALWKWKGENNWERVGGKTEETEDLQMQLFSSTIPSTGVFGLFDEDPAPDFVPTFPIDQIDLVEPDPFAIEEISNDASGLPNAASGLSGEDIPENPIPLSENEDFIPPVEVEGQDGSPTEIDILVPPLEGSDTQSIPQADSSVSMPDEEVSSSPDGLLPASGPEGEVETARFPFLFLFAILVLGTSAFSAFSGKKQTS